MGRGARFVSLCSEPGHSWQAEAMAIPREGVLTRVTAAELSRTAARGHGPPSGKQHAREEKPLPLCWGQAHL